MASRYMYEYTLQNSYLGKVKVIKAQTKYELELKAKEQIKKWDLEVMRLKERERVADLKAEAEELSEQAINEIEGYKNILLDTLKVDELDWESMYNRELFPEFTYSKRLDLQTIKKKYNVSLMSKLAKILPFLKKQYENLEKKAQDEFNMLEEQYNTALKEYDEKRVEFLQKQDEENIEAKRFKEEFEEGHGEAIEKYVRVVLERSSFPDSFNKEFDVAYDPFSETVIINYQLPHPVDMPKTVEYKYVASKNEISSKEMKKKDFDAFYEDVIYKVALRNFHEIFESVYIDHVKAVIFNGWVKGIDPGTGNELTTCIITCRADRNAFESYNLEFVSAKVCVRNLKGLVAGPLYQIAPVRPIMDINRDDSRFVESQDVLDGMEVSMNLAEMEWEMFEHLVRELFAKIFSKDGAEVKVTQASRDGGVDAIAFDPDPIRGGKFVIQAKRYNNVVPVSAVRDLYGTMISEGAVKGILVTTSYYGSDSREFVKDKPVSLIDGPNLVYMLQEFGYNATIRLKNKSV